MSESSLNYLYFLQDVGYVRNNSVLIIMEFFQNVSKRRIRPLEIRIDESKKAAETMKMNCISWLQYHLIWSFQRGVQLEVLQKHDHISKETFPKRK